MHSVDPELMHYNAKLYDMHKELSIPLISTLTDRSAKIKY